jgi:hypothetical protein
MRAVSRGMKGGSVLGLVAGITLVVTALLVVYLRRIPDGLLCPRCGTPVQRDVAPAEPRSAARGGLLDRWLDRAQCVSCPWRGRVRGGTRLQAVRVELRNSGGKA